MAPNVSASGPVPWISAGLLAAAPAPGSLPTAVPTQVSHDTLSHVPLVVAFCMAAIVVCVSVAALTVAAVMRIKATQHENLAYFQSVEARREGRQDVTMVPETQAIVVTQPDGAEDVAVIIFPASEAESDKVAGEKAAAVAEADRRQNSRRSTMEQFTRWLTAAYDPSTEHGLPSV
eukprot:jgi/Astpho2/8066/Aster-03013